MATLHARFATLKKRIDGNREFRAVRGYEETFADVPMETLNHITPVNPAIRRIVGELRFALRLNEARGGCFDQEIDRALTVLESAIEEDGVLTKSICLKAEAALAPLAPAAKEYTVLLVGHAHIDMNWMWTWNETVAATLATFRTMLDIMDEYPDFHFSQSQASVYKIVEDYDPDMMERIKARIAEGRWEITAAAWVETDKNMPSTESLLRHIQYTKTYLRDKWGVDPASLEIDFSPDTFGHSANLPEINLQGDVKYYYHCRALKEQDRILYRWKGQSGREVLCYREPHWYNSTITPKLGPAAIEHERLCAGMKTSMAVYGVGDHGGGPTRRDLDRAIEMMAWPIFPTLKFGTLRELFHAAEAVRDQLPLVDHELNFIFQGCYTTQSRIKMGNRAAERALVAAEGINALAAAKVGAPVRAEKYEQAWRDTLFTHFHDILTGSCTPESREYAMGLYANVQATAQTQLDLSLRAVAAEIDTSAIPCEVESDSRAPGAGVGFGVGTFGGGFARSERGVGRTRIFHVFNPTAVKKCEPVEITVWDWTGDMKQMHFRTADGAPLPFQPLHDRMQTYWGHALFSALVTVEVAPFGYTTVVLEEAPITTPYPLPLFHPDNVPHDQTCHATLENEFLRAVFDKQSGRMISLWDKVGNREMLKPGESAGACLIDTERATSDAWKIGQHRAIHPIGQPLRIVNGDNGGLRRGIMAEYRVRDSLVRVSVSLTQGSPALHYHIEADWHEYKGDYVAVLAYNLPLAEAPASWQYDIPGGVISRPSFNNDVPGLQYALATTGATRAAGIVNASKYGYRALEDGTLIATFINSTYRPDPYPEFGKHSIHFHVGLFDPDPKAMEEVATSLNNPLIYLPATGTHTGKLPTTGAFLNFRSKATVVSSLTAVKDGWRVRLYNTGDSADTCTLGLDRPLTGAVLVDVLDAPRGDLPIKDGCAVWDIPAHGVQSVIVKM